MSFNDFLMCPVEHGTAQIGLSVTVTPSYVTPVQHVTIKPARKRVRPRKRLLNAYLFQLMQSYLELKTKNS